MRFNHCQISSAFIRDRGCNGTEIFLLGGGLIKVESTQSVLALNLQDTTRLYWVKHRTRAA
ncbi:hypothetical protein [Phormidium sp. CCY1219]|uniref:hypothetical protein n=1 Tax=Phormidium sp. CCY1219 TaxID=2886104 RepID=UPI002D778C43|nr:hypothetical protein [Phormidium sp. CCY1219]